MLIKPAAIEDAGDDDNCPKTGMCRIIRSPIFHGNEASGGAQVSKTKEYGIIENNEFYFEIFYFFTKYIYMIP